MGRIGYGFNRREKEFDGLRLDKLFLDFKGGDREERSAMWSACRPGDTIVMLAKGDLGRGGELLLLRSQIAERGVTIEVASIDAEPAGKPGAPTVFAPDDKQRARLKRMWTDGMYSRGYVLGQLLEMAGWPDDAESRKRARNWLNHNISLRSGKSARRTR